MVKSSKILTVSYGTFSCTLEGFDDAFDTMKAIAEYFRDLAADDRYFGAEPPTPDADMLAKIAEREIARRVEARDTGDGIVLRPSLAAAAAGVAAAPALAQEEQRPQDDDPALETVSEDTDTVDAPVEDTPAAFETVEDSTDLVVPEAAAEEEEPAAAEEAGIDETEAGQPIVDETAEEESREEAVVPSETEVDDADEDIVAEIVESDQDHSLSDSPDVDAVEPLGQADIDSVAAKLKRIRDVVSHAEETPAAATDFSEDEHAEDFLAATARDIEAALNEPSDSPENEAAEAQFDEELSDEVAEHAAEEVTEVASEDANEDAVSDDDLRTDDAEEAEEAVAQEETAEHDAPEDDDSDASELSAMFDAAEAAEDSDEVEGARKPVRAQVIKMKRADLEAAIADRELEKAAEAEAQAADENPDEIDETSLSDEDEAELQRELAEVEAEMAEESSPADEVAEEEAAPEEEAAKADDEDDFDLFGDDEDEDDEDTPSILADDRDVDRLMTEADSQLDQPEAKGRRAAIAHLRAAVAAAKEERKAGTSLTDTSDQTVDYKEDLANVVRPRRPASRPNRSERPSDPAAGPLKLVAEQRIDLDQPAPAATGIVRPRRVSSRVMREQEATAEAAATLEAAAPVGDDGFAAYAEQMGATELPELLEAAASYLSFVEGKAQFSRPQLMTRVRDSYAGEFSREDGLRSFGQLLREGKIEKIKGGRFTVSDHIGFQPKARATG